MYDYKQAVIDDMIRFLENLYDDCPDMTAKDFHDNAYMIHSDMREDREVSGFGRNGRFGKDCDYTDFLCGNDTVCTDMIYRFTEMDENTLYAYEIASMILHPEIADMNIRMYMVDRYYMDAIEQFIRKWKLK